MRLKAQAVAVFLDISSHGPSSIAELVERTEIPDTTMRRICRTLLSKRVLVQTRLGVYDVGTVEPTLPLWARGLAKSTDEPLCKRLYLACEKKLKKLDALETGILEGYPPFKLARRVHGRRKLR